MSVDIAVALAGKDLATLLRRFEGGGRRHVHRRIDGAMGARRIVSEMDRAGRIIARCYGTTCEGRFLLTWRGLLARVSRR